MSGQLALFVPARIRAPGRPVPAPARKWPTYGELRNQLRLERGRRFNVETQLEIEKAENARLREVIESIRGCVDKFLPA